MADGQNEELPDLLRYVTGGTETNNAVGFHQLDAETIRLRNQAIHAFHDFQSGSSRAALSGWNAFEIDSDPWVGLSMLQSPLALPPTGSASHGHRSLGDFAGHVNPRATMLDRPELVDTIYMGSYSPEANLSCHQEAGAGSIATQAQNWPQATTTQYQTHQTTAFTVSRAAAHHGNHEWTDRTVPVTLTYGPGMHMLSRQDEVCYNVGADGNNADSGVHGVPDNGSHGPEIPSRHSGPGLSVKQSQGKSGAPSEPVACPICNTRLQDKSGLRHHLNIHDPQKASRYKCNGCPYASRFPKDVRRHQLVHQKPKDHQFVCHEVGCTAKYHRKDYLTRHSRKHRDSRSVLSARSTAASRLGDGMSSTGSYLVVEALSDTTPGTEMSSFDMCLDPSLK